jgi:hypothetical protein
MAFAATPNQIAALGTRARRQQRTMYPVAFERFHILA